MRVGERIKSRRKEIGLSAEEVAKELGVSPATVYRYESNDIMNMRIDKLEPIAKALPISWVGKMTKKKILRPKARGFLKVSIHLKI